MTQIIKYVTYTSWTNRTEVEYMGDVSDMVALPVCRTVLSGRSATVEEWCNEETGNGFERITIDLFDWEK